MYRQELESLILSTQDPNEWKRKIFQYYCKYLSHRCNIDRSDGIDTKVISKSWINNLSNNNKTKSKLTSMLDIPTSTNGVIPYFGVFSQDLAAVSNKTHL